MRGIQFDVTRVVITQAPTMAAEQLRRLLLKEMGITSWFPRTPLPGAALSHEQCLRNFLAEELHSGATAAVETGAPGAARDYQRPSEPGHASAEPGLARLAELLATKTAESPMASAPAVKTAATEALATGSTVVASVDESGAASANNTPEEEAARFGFSWFNVDRRLAVLAMLPDGNTRLTSSCRQMLARLLAALYTPWQSLELSEQSFHWPFADDLGLPADKAAAGQAVDGFIARRLREQNCAMLLVLCDGLPWFLQSPTATAQNPLAGDTASRLQAHRQFGFTLLATHSLHAMEKDAGLKREAWQSLQVVRERLNRDINQ